MDPNNQNPQVGDQSLAKLEQDLKSLNTQANQTPQSSVVNSSTPADQVTAAPSQTILTPSAPSTIEAAAPQVQPQGLPHGFPTAAHNTPAVAPQPVSEVAAEPKVATSEPNPAFTPGGVGSPPPLPQEGKKNNLILTIAFVLMAVAVLAAVAYVIGNSFTSKKTQDKSNEVAPVATPITTQESSPSASALQTTPPDSSASATTDTTTQIEIKDFKFSEGAKVKAGATVTFVNNDSVGHSITADDGSFDTGVIAAGQKATFTAPSKAGTYKFHCNPHPTITGSLIVEVVSGS